MKKLIFIFSILFIALLLISCDDGEKTDPTIVIDPIDLDVAVVSEEVINNQIHISVTITSPLETSAILVLMNEIANEVYLDYFEEIDGRLFYLNISGFDALSSYQNAEDPHFGIYVYGINLGLDKPGLSFVRID